MAIKKFDYSKIESSIPVTQIDKGQVKTTPLHNAFGNAEKIVANKLPVRPIPRTGTFGEE